LATSVIGGIARGCEISNCALIGGETAEMPGMYPGDEYDLAGFAVGAVEKEKILTGAEIDAGDTILGLASSGAHSNGYSLIRKIIASSGTDLNEKIGDRTLADLVLEPTRIYVPSVLKALKTDTIKGLAHITGGGLVENIPRILPDHTVAEIQLGSWSRPALFDWLQGAGNVEVLEMNRVFNCGIGMVVICDKSNSTALKELLSKLGEQVFEIGTIRQRNGNEHQTQLIS
jgi:phosphoribosylformylglycinamidine cyclo-ligase